jgi:hypothetical protein
MSQTSTSGHQCYLGPDRQGNTYDELNKDPKFAYTIKTRHMGAYEDNFYFPIDISPLETLRRVEALDPSLEPGTLEASARRAILDIADRPTTVWPGAEFEPIADLYLGRPLCDSPSRIFDWIASLATVRPKKHIGKYHYENGPTDNLGSLVFKTEDGKLVLLQRLQQKCHAPGCPEPTFRNGQRTAFDRDGNWTHPNEAGPQTELGPLGEFTDVCTAESCRGSFVTSPLMATDLTGRYPVHAYQTEDDTLVTCESPSMIDCSD